MPEGPLGLPRPMVRTKIFINREELDVSIRRVGPVGFSRPLSESSDGEVTEEDIQECMESRAAHKFAKGMQKNPWINSQEEVEEATRSWCEGILNSTTEPTNDPAELMGEEFVPPEAEIINVEGEVIDDQTELPEGDS